MYELTNVEALLMHESIFIIDYLFFLYSACHARLMHIQLGFTCWPRGYEHRRIPDERPWLMNVFIKE
jgi:hypothetical protein